MQESHAKYDGHILCIYTEFETYIFRSDDDQQPRLPTNFFYSSKS